MSEYVAPPPPTRYAPHVLLATTVVAVLPVGASLALRASGVISSSWLATAIAVAASVAASAAGGALWKKRKSAGDILFSELLLWGWAVRWWQERQLANATKLLGVARSPDASSSLSAKEQEHLLRQLAAALEAQDVFLHGHSRRVARHAVMIARSMGLDRDDVARIRAAAAVHDIGKLRTPVDILAKPAPLTDSEFEVIKRHPVDGAEMVAALGDDQLTAIVMHHHERIDGGGYPSGLVRDEIPLGARIVAVADTFDAITSARAYRPPARHKKAIDILRAETGRQLDPAAVRAFLGYYSGSRPLVIWAVCASALRRVVAWLSGDPAGAAMMSTGNVVATTAATAVIGVAAVVAPLALVGKVHSARVADRSVAAQTGAGGAPPARRASARHETSRARPLAARPPWLRGHPRAGAGVAVAEGTDSASGGPAVAGPPPSSADAPQSTSGAGGGGRAVRGGSTRRGHGRGGDAQGNRGGNDHGGQLADRTSDQGANGQGPGDGGKGGNNDASGHGKPILAAPTSVTPPCRALWRSHC